MKTELLNKKGKPRLPFLLFLILSGVVIISLAFGIGHAIGENMNKRAISANRTALPTITLATQPATTVIAVTLTPQNAITKQPAPTQPTLIPTMLPQCGSSEAVIYVLLIAKDYEEGNKEGTLANDYSTGFADAIRVARIDYRTGDISLLAIPRDLMVSIPGLEKYGIYQERIKMAYAYGYQYETPGLGPVMVADTLATNFGFHIDYTLTINFSSFYELVETLGGLEIDVSEDVGQFPAGHYSMSGFQALAYARLRDKAGEDQSDLGRIKRQTQLVFAIRDKVFSPDMLPNIPELIPQFLNFVSTDLTLVEINRLLCLSREISTFENIEMDEEYFTIQIDAFGYERYLPHYVQIRELVDRFQDP